MDRKKIKLNFLMIVRPQYRLFSCDSRKTPYYGKAINKSLERSGASRVQSEQ